MHNLTRKEHEHCLPSLAHIRGCCKEENFDGRVAGVNAYKLCFSIGDVWSGRVSANRDRTARQEARSGASVGWLVVRLLD